jgi:glucose/mannose-6-phosphate isomerase
MNRPALLDDPEAVARLDRHGAGRALSDFPAQCRAAVQLTPFPPPQLEARHVVLAAMGGSAASGDLLVACAAERLPVPVVVRREYGLPMFVGEGSLVVASSYSGGTEEVLSLVEMGLERKATIAVITSGGALGELAERRALPLVTLPKGFMPRHALGYLFFPLLRILESVNLTPVSLEEREEALTLLDVMARELGPDRSEANNEAKRLAIAFAGRVPVVYGGELTATAAFRWNTEVEENAKLLAFHGALPEMAHNEIEAWGAAEARFFYAVFLRDRGERPAMARRFAVTRDLIAEGPAGVTEVWSRGEGPLARLLSLIYVGDWVSYYLALLRGVDPWPVPVLETVKRRLAAPPAARPEFP